MHHPTVVTDAAQEYRWNSKRCFPAGILKPAGKRYRIRDAPPNTWRARTQINTPLHERGRSRLHGAAGQVPDFV